MSKHEFKSSSDYRTAGTGGLPPPAAALFILAVLCLSFMLGREALCRPIVLVQSSGSTAAIFCWLTHTHTERNRLKVSFDLAFWRMVPDDNGGKWVCRCTLFLKSPKLNSFQCQLHALICTSACCLHTHAPPGVGKHICQQDKPCICQYAPFSSTET